MVDILIWLRQQLHRIPHLDLNFRPVDNVFVWDMRDTYTMALGLLALFALVIGGLFLLCLVAVWITACCTSKSGAHSRRSVRRLTITLFLLNVICFILLAACLFGNDYTTRALITRVTPQMNEVSTNLRISNEKLGELANSQNNISIDVSQLKTQVEDKARQPGVNQTAVSQVNAQLDRIINLWKEMRQRVEHSQKVLYGLPKLETAYRNISRWEFERWIMVVTLLSIMFAVLFVGVLAICKKSRGAIIAFSGIGIVIFVLGWTIFSVMFPTTVAYSDFCETGKQFVSEYFPEGIYNTLNYYQKCVPDGSYADTFSELQLNKIDELLGELKHEDASMRSTIHTLFGEDGTTKSLVSEISAITADGFKSLGTINTFSSCTQNHPRVNAIVSGFCYDGFLGNVIFLVAIFFFGIFMAFLLMVASRGWYAFERLPNDYVEVGDDDPFYTRGTAQDNAIVTDIYGTHVCNPRSRFATNSADNNTESTGTNSGGGHIGEQRTPLLISDHPTWQSPPTDMSNGPHRYI